MVFADIPASKAFAVGADGKATPLPVDTKRASGHAYGPDGRRYAVATETGQILAYDADGKVSTIAEGFRGNDLVVAHDGGIYVTNPGDPKPEENKVWYIARDGTKRVVDSGPRYPNGVALSPDQTQLYIGRWAPERPPPIRVADGGGVRVRSYAFPASGSGELGSTLDRSIRGVPWRCVPGRRVGTRRRPAAASVAAG